MADVPLLAGIYTDCSGDIRTAYPRNLVPVPKPVGIGDGYLRPASGIVPFGATASLGKDRGGIVWNGVCYRVMNNALVMVREDGTFKSLGVLSVVVDKVVRLIGGVQTTVEVISPTPIQQSFIRKSGKQTAPGTTPPTPTPLGAVKTLDPFASVRMEYGPDRLAIWANGHLYYWRLGDVDVMRVTDADLGRVIDGCWIAGYFISTDGEFLISTDITDPLSVNQSLYGTAESDPDDIRAVAALRNELYAFGRRTIEVYQNIGGTLFPFQRIESAQVPRGTIGRKTWTPYLNTFAFLGGGKDESPAVYIMTPGNTQKLSTREIDATLAEYTEEQLEDVILESRVDRGHNNLLIHLPDQTLVYDDASSNVLKTPVWHTLTSSLVGRGRYQAQGLTWCYSKWIVGRSGGVGLGLLDDTTSDHYGEVVGWDVSTPIAYNNGDGAIVGEVELVAITGRCKEGVVPAIWTSYSHDGMTWSQERSISAGNRGQRQKRLVWRNQGTIRHWRVQMIRGTSDAQITPIKLSIEFEALHG